MLHNSAMPNIQVDSETYEVRADGNLITCEPASVLPLAQLFLVLILALSSQVFRKPIRFTKRCSQQSVRASCQVC
jgi:hypothetical protein